MDGILATNDVCDTYLLTDYNNCHCDSSICTMVLPATKCDWYVNVTNSSIGYSDCFVEINSSSRYLDPSYLQLRVKYNVSVNATFTYTTSANMCNKLFASSSYSLLGDSPTCSLNGSYLYINLGPNNKISSNTQL